MNGRVVKSMMAFTITVYFLSLINQAAAPIVTMAPAPAPMSRVATVVNAFETTRRMLKASSSSSSGCGKCCVSFGKCLGKTITCGWCRDCGKNRRTVIYTPCYSCRDHDDHGHPPEAQQLPQTTNRLAMIGLMENNPYLNRVPMLAPMGNVADVSAGRGYQPTDFNLLLPFLLVILQGFRHIGGWSTYDPLTSYVQNQCAMFNLDDYECACFKKVYDNFDDTELLKNFFTAAGMSGTEIEFETFLQAMSNVGARKDLGHFLKELADEYFCSNCGQSSGFIGCLRSTTTNIWKRIGTGKAEILAKFVENSVKNQ